MEITKFLGLHLSLTGDTNLLPGELSQCKNIRITSDYKARKREGYTELFPALNSPIRGQWQGYINGTFYHLFACGGKLYKTENGVNTEIGSLADNPTSFFYFGSKVYILDGQEYRSFDGTTLAVVEGYVPIIAIGTPPAGGGTDYEGINLLNGKKRQRFSADGTAKDFVIRETSVNSVDKVYVNGELKTVTTDYTVDLSNGKITFVTAPTTGQDNIEIWWTKGTGSRTEVTGHTQYSLFGGKNDTRVFLYGNGTNTMIFSDLADGVPSAEYFPALNYSTVGSDEYPITYVTKQYDRQIIFTTKGAYYSTYDYDIEIGANFPVYPLNDKIGNIPLGQGQLIKNNPFTITYSVWEWLATSVRDERNAVKKSDRVQPALDNLDLSTAITYDYEELQEYWLCVGNQIYIYNYGNDTWYYFELAHTPTSFITIDGVLYMGTANGQIMKWAQYNDIGKIPEYLTDNGIVIKSEFRTGAMDFGVNYRRKFLNFAWIGLKPESKSVCFVEWETDYDASSEPEVIYYSLIDFDNIDFADFSFQTNYNPQPFRLKLKAKKFTYFELIITNESETETMTILSINLPAVVGGVSK